MHDFGCFILKKNTTNVQGFPPRLNFIDVDQRHGINRQHLGCPQRQANWLKEGLFAARKLEIWVLDSRPKYTFPRQPHKY